MEQDLQTYSKIGRALWADVPFADRVSVDTFAAVTLADIAEEQRLERAVSGMIERAMRDGMAGNARRNGAVMDIPFYRLMPRERVILVALHLGRWSYARLARILGLTTEQVQEIAWSARTKVAGKSPAGARPVSASCPEYLSTRPWTQRFLDDELENTKDRMFLQNHLMACNSCSAALRRCKDFYYSVDGVLTRLIPGPNAGVLETLESLSFQARPMPPQEPTLSEIALDSFARFTRHRDVQVVLGALALAIAWKIFSR